MTLIETHEYQFPSHLLPALINNDPAIDEEDKSCFNEFIKNLEQYRIEYGATSYIIDYEDISYYSHTNCLFKVGCDVTDIRVYFVSTDRGK